MVNSSRISTYKSCRTYLGAPNKGSTMLILHSKHLLRCILSFIRITQLEQKFPTPFPYTLNKKRFEHSNKCSIRAYFSKCSQTAQTALMIEDRHEQRERLLNNKVEVKTWSSLLLTLKVSERLYSVIIPSEFSNNFGYSVIIPSEFSNIPSARILIQTSSYRASSNL